MVDIFQEDPRVAEMEQLADESAGPFREFFGRFFRQGPAIVATVILGVLVVLAVFAPLLAPYGQNDQDLANALQGPSSAHWFGTDELGRDVFTRILWAGRVSLVAAFQAVGIAFVIGVPAGLVSGFFGRWTDSVIMRISDTLMSFPPLLLAIAIVGVLGPGLTNSMIAVGVIFAPRFARLVRAVVLELRHETYVLAARSIGVRPSRIISGHLLPNIVAPLVVQVSLAAGFAMLAEASLSFIGLGVQPPQASWGSMLGRGYRYLSDSPTLVVFPGIMIGLAVLSFNLIGDGVRDSIGREIRRE